MVFQPTANHLFYTRGDPADPRLGDVFKGLSLEKILSKKPDFVLAGYPDDEGIQLNKGRIGAKDGPDAIRGVFYKMTYPSTDINFISLNDLGNLDGHGPIGERHETAKTAAQKVLEIGSRWLSLGGGHDYAYADGSAFLNAFAGGQQRPLIINFDAHLDVRSTEKGFNSGTPFFRILEEYENFDFVEVGIQKHCNSQKHFDWCKQHGGLILTWDEFMFSGLPLTSYLTEKLGDLLLKPRPTFLSIDIDGFSANYAMGCSQSWSTGFHPNEFFVALQMLINHLDVKALGIYEVSPPLDFDNHTAKLAAQILYQFIFGQTRHD